MRFVKIKHFYLTILVLFVFLLLLLVIRAVTFNPARTFIIGIDAASPRVIEQLIRRGKLPHLAYLIRNGAYGIHDAHDVNPDRILSPIIWTSIATGVLPDAHGINVDPSSKQAITDEISAQLFATTDEVKAPTLWEMFDRNGKTSAVVHWWVTYPAEQIKGFIVSNVATKYFAQFYHIMSWKEWAGNGQRLTHPDRLYSRLLKSEGRYRRGIDAVAGGLRKGVWGKIDIAEDLDRSDSARYKITDYLKYAYVFDEETLAYTQYLLEEHPRLKLMATYFIGVDVFSHVFWAMREIPERIEQGYLDKYQSMIDDYYELTDAYVGRLLRYVDDNDTVVVCSDHGMQLEKDDVMLIEKKQVMTGRHDPLGIIVLYGKNIKKGVVLEGASLLDIAPTVMYLNGLPLSDVFAGGIIAGAIEDDFIQNNSPRFTRYDVKDRRLPDGGRRVEYPDKDEKEKMFRALGYLN